MKLLFIPPGELISKVSSFYRSQRVSPISLPIIFLIFQTYNQKILDNSSPKRPNPKSKSSYSLREVHSPEEDIGIVSASQSGLLTRFNKDQRGSYLAVPTGITH